MLVGRRGRIAGQRRLQVVDADPEGTLGQVVEQVVAGAIGGLRTDQDIACARLEDAVAVVDVQLDLDAGDAGLTRILHAVAVVVAEHRVADGAKAGIAEVDTGYVGARHHHRPLAGVGRRRRGLQVSHLAGVV